MSALEDQLDVVVDADGAGDALLHLAVARLQLLQQVVLLRVLVAGAAVHLRLVCVINTDDVKAMRHRVNRLIYRLLSPDATQEGTVLLIHRATG